MAGFANLHQRDFMYCHHGSVVWDPMKKKALLWKWKMMDRALMLIGFGYLIFCVVFVGLFICSVTDRDKFVFMTTTMAVTFKAWLVMPLALSMILAAFANVLRTSHPSIEKIEFQLGLSQKEILELQGRAIASPTDEVEIVDSHGGVVAAEQPLENTVEPVPCRNNEFSVTFSRRDSLGLNFSPCTLEGKPMLTRIRPDTQAEECGDLQPGQVLISVDGKKVSTFEDAMELLRMGLRPVTLTFADGSEVSPEPTTEEEHPSHAENAEMDPCSPDSENSHFGALIKLAEDQDVPDGSESSANRISPVVELTAEEVVKRWPKIQPDIQNKWKCSRQCSSRACPQAWCTL
eukprot:gnl/MRDRNA2_/MRDRNA2_53543_c0_seq1.p1 gnl/MRDRNA2_/MRDRNA2_53543_c0~~gnl/MRDRNA2_/MRDRNA2_53543_c0_seq1.p1  ORF type:complete len:358 (+),score=51.64 gnl/MRDRNA2_/MRDRNA2_53543_c0_seq1:34-1074(+)